MCGGWCNIRTYSTQVDFFKLLNIHRHDYLRVMVKTHRVDTLSDSGHTEIQSYGEAELFISELGYKGFSLVREYYHKHLALCYKVN